MKQMIITVGLLILGTVIFSMMMNGPDSLYQVSQEAVNAAKEVYGCMNLSQLWLQRSFCPCL